MKITSKEHYEIMAQFERIYAKERLARETDKMLWRLGHVYQDGNVNRLFIAFRHGVAFGLASTRT